MQMRGMQVQARCGVGAALCCSVDQGLTIPDKWQFDGARLKTATANIDLDLLTRLGAQRQARKPD